MKIQPPSETVSYKGFSSYLKRHYTSEERAVIQPFTGIDDPVLDLDIVFTRLRVIQREKERSTETNEEVAIHEVFKPHNDSEKLRPRTVLIEGMPGIGKTTFCQKLAYDWAKGKVPSSSSSSFPEVELLLLLKCRDIEKGGIWQAIEDQLLPEELTGNNEKRELFQSIIKNPEKVLLIIDGYDELPAEKSVQESLMKVISGRALSRCSIIVTTRHEKGTKVRKHFDNLLEIRGFEWSDTCQFIKRYFHNSPKAKCIIDLMRRYYFTLEDFVSSPLNLALLCVVYEERKDRLSVERNVISLRELYHEIVFCITKRYHDCVKMGEEDVSDDTLMEDYHAIHMILGKLAFDGLQSDELYIKESQLPANEREVLSKLGFLVKEKSARKLSSAGVFSFIHKTIQEYFAALYIVDCLTDGDTQACSIQRIEMISILNRFEILDTDDFKLSPRKSIHLMQCLAALLPPRPECREQGLIYVKDSYLVFTFLCELIGSLRDETEMQETANLAYRYLPEWVHFHYHSDKGVNGLCCLLSLSGEEISNPSDSTSDLVSFSDVTKTSKSALSHLKVTGLDEDEEISDAMLHKFAQALSQNKILRILDLRDVYHIYGFNTLLNALCRNTCLTHLFCICGGEDNDINVLGQALCEMQSLVYLKLSVDADYRKCFDFSAIADALSNDPKLVVLDVSWCCLDVMEVSKIAHGLITNNNLTVLNMEGNKSVHFGACAIGEMLEKNKSLKELYLQWSNLDSHDCTALAHVLTTNYTLILLDISGNKIGDQGACAIADTLMINSSLSHLYINGCGFTDVGTCAIANVLKSKNETLTHLGMAANHVEDAIRAIVDLLTVNTTLTYLNISWSREHCQYVTRALADAVSRNMTLTYIGIGETSDPSTLTHDPRVHVWKYTEYCSIP